MNKFSAVFGKKFLGFKRFEALPFSRENVFKFTGTSRHDIDDEEPASPDSALTDPPTQIFELLTFLKCSTIVVEKNYTDRDYKAEFTALYAKRFYTPPPRCIRLHFFSESLSSEKFLEEIDRLDNASYLGYCVVRPTEFNRVGRTIIKLSTSPLPNPQRPNKAYITCHAEFEVNILGRRFKISGFPFIQQDTQVGVCAHAALWMISRYMSVLGYCHEFLPSDINILAKAHQPRGRTYPAEQGLVTVQMLDALHGMGLSAIHYNRNNLPENICEHIKLPAGETDDLVSKKMGDLIYRYIESRLPVLLTTKDHAVVALGHTLQSKPQVPNNIDQIPSFIVNDDGRGPYVELPVFRKAGIKHCLDDVVDIIAILPGAVMLTGEYAEESARSTLELVPELLRSGSADQIAEAKKLEEKLWSTYWLRTYLLPSEDFRRDLKNPQSGEVFDPLVASALIRLDYPKYVWISEVFISEDKTPRCVGKIIVDSSAAKSDRCVMVVIMGKAVILFDRRHPNATPPSAILENECKFIPKAIGFLAGRL
jgi:hypothetical protein